MTVLAARMTGFALSLIAIGLSGCDRSTVTAKANINLEQATDAERDQAAMVLRARFEAIAPSMFSSVDVKRSGADIVLVFRGEPPSDEEIRSYAASRGVMRMAPQDSPHNWLVTDRDVESVSVSGSSQGPVLDLRVSERAGQRLLQYTSRNQGKVLVTTWDEDAPFHASIQGIFSRQFQTTGFDAETAMRRRIILESGRLPVAVRNVEISHP
jgi:preprotein translocase subunit SecD